MAQVRVSGSPFVADHLLWAVRMLSHVWEQVDDKFAEDFGAGSANRPLRSSKVTTSRTVCSR